MIHILFSKPMPMMAGQKGENRYYRAADVYSSALNWWNYIFVIAKKGSQVQRTMSFGGLDVRKIPIGSGR